MAQLIIEIPDENLKAVKNELWLAVCFRQNEILNRHDQSPSSGWTRLYEALTDVRRQIIERG